MTVTFTLATFTLEQFAALPPAWTSTLYATGGVLLARIHPRNNRPHGDEDVLARALAFIPPHTHEPYGAWDSDEPVRSEGHPARLTIRTGHVSYPSEYVGPDYAELLRVVLTLPVIELEARP